MGCTRIKRSCFLFLAMAMAMSAGQAQTPIPYTAPPKHQRTFYRNGFPVYKNGLQGVLATQMWDWTTEKWDGDNKPYHQARLDIDKVADAGQGLDELLAKDKAQAQKRPDDALAVFRWAYTAYRVMLARYTREAQFAALDGVQVALRLADSPHTYDYARIQFLVGEFYTSHKEAVPIAKRLLLVDKNDYHVEYCLAVTYLNDYVSPDFEAALTLCRHLKQLYPKKPSVYAVTGEAYVLWWYKAKNPADAQAAIENYEKYLQLAPPQDQFRKRAQGIINEFKSRV